MHEYTKEELDRMWIFMSEEQRHDPAIYEAFMTAYKRAK